MIHRVALALLITCGFAGCATTRPSPATLTPDQAAADFAARTLQDAGLRHFLADNLGREPGNAPWDFETLSWVAFYYHPSLGVARAQWATARAAQATAGLRPNPTLTLTPGYNTTREPGISPWFPAINFDFLFPSSDKRLRQQDIARAEAEVARLGVVNAAWQVRSELRHALLDAANASRRSAVLRAQADAQRALVTLMQQRFDAGGATASELANARTALLRAEASAGEVQSQSTTARVRVATALGVPLTALQGITLPALPPAPELSREALAAARSESLRGRADILAALAKYRSTQAALELEIAKQVPDFHLGPGYQWDQGGNKWSLTLSFELPVFHRNEGPIAEATARRAEAAAQFTAVQAQVIGMIDASVAAQAAAVQQREHAREIRAEMEKQRARVQQRVELGAADQLELQLARIELTSIDTVLLDADVAVASAASQLEDALQLPFPHLAALADASHSSGSSSSP